MEKIDTVQEESPDSTSEKQTDETKQSVNPGTQNSSEKFLELLGNADIKQSSSLEGKSKEAVKDSSNSSVSAFRDEAYATDISPTGGHEHIKQQTANLVEENILPELSLD